MCGDPQPVSAIGTAKTCKVVDVFHRRHCLIKSLNCLQLWACIWCARHYYLQTVTFFLPSFGKTLNHTHTHTHKSRHCSQKWCSKHAQKYLQDGGIDEIMLLAVSA